MSFNPEYFYPTIITNITSLNGGQFGTVQATDIYPAVDVTDFTQSPYGTTKPYQILQLINYILDNFGFDIYLPVLAASPSNLNAIYNNGASGVGATLTNSGTQAAFSLDGQIGTLNGRYLINNQTNQSQNGIYILTNIGSNTTNWILTRSSDFNQPSNIIDGGIVYVINGNTYSNTYWQVSFSSPFTVGTTPIIWMQWSFVPSELIWFEVTTTAVSALPNHGYVINRNTQVQITLPSTFNVGDVIEIRGLGTGGWAVIPNTGQTIQFGSSTISVSIQSTIQYSNLTIRGLVPNTTWTIDITNENPQVS